MMTRFGWATAILIAMAAPAAADVTLGTAGPMTGPYAIFGDQMKRGAQWFVADANARGGVLGQKLALEIGDDACDPKQAVNVANLMAQKRVAAVIGHYCSGSSIPASAVYQEEGIIQISPASTNPRFTDEPAAKGWWNVFRTCGRDDKQGVVAGQFLAEKFKGKRVAVLHDKSPYGKGLADETRGELNRRGVKEVLYEAYTPGEKDYNAIVSRLKAESVDVVYVGGYHTEVGLMLRQAVDAGLKVQFMSGDANASDELWQITGPAGEGFLMTFGPDQRKNPSAASVVESMRKQGIEPEGYTLYTVAALQVWAEAVRKAGKTDGKTVAGQIRGQSFDTVIGKLTFDAKGDVLDPKYVVYRWSAGKYAELE